MTRACSRSPGTMTAATPDADPVPLTPEKTAKYMIPPPVPGGEAYFGGVRVPRVLSQLGLRTIRNIGRGNCFAWAVEDASEKNIPAQGVRPRARAFINENPNNRYVRQLTAQEVAEIDSDGIDITDNQAKIFALAFGFDLLFLDTTQSTAYLVESTGAARYLDQAQCVRVLRGRKDDFLNPLNVLKYTPGHYEGVRWPRAGELQQP